MAQATYHHNRRRYIYMFPSVVVAARYLPVELLLVTQDHKLFGASDFVQTEFILCNILIYYINYKNIKYQMHKNRRRLLVSHN